MESKISVFIKEPFKAPRHVNISPSLENLQKTVGGNIEVVRLSADMVMLCDEEGKLKNTKYNFKLFGDHIFGPVIFAGISGEKFSDVPISFGKFKGLFPHLFKEGK